MPENSTPDIWVRGGLLDAKHRHAMGEAVWLYLYLHSVVRLDGRGAGESRVEQPYRHGAAADVLGLGLRTVKRMFERLEDGGYIRVTKRLPYGLLVRLSKYEDARTRAAQRRKRSAATGTSTLDERSAATGTSEGSLAEEKCQILYREVPDLSNRSAATGTSVYKVARAETGNDRNESPIGDALTRQPTPIQEIVDTWMGVIGRVPGKAKDYGRWAAIASEMVERGDQPTDVGNCTKWLRTNPFYAQNGKAPHLDDVRDALPAWIEQRRPGTWRDTQRTTLRGGPTTQQPKSAAGREMAELRAEGVIDEHGNFV